MADKALVRMITIDKKCTANHIAFIYVLILLPEPLHNLTAGQEAISL